MASLTLSPGIHLERHPVHGIGVPLGDEGDGPVMSFGLDKKFPPPYQGHELLESGYKTINLPATSHYPRGKRFSVLSQIGIARYGAIVLVKAAQDVAPGVSGRILASAPRIDGDWQGYDSLVAIDSGDFLTVSDPQGWGTVTLAIDDDRVWIVGKAEKHERHHRI